MSGAVSDSTTNVDLKRIGAVAIGRNEGERLKKCLESLTDRLEHVVYVDSGSTDDSIALARSLNVAIIELDASIPFSAARARNEGVEKLLGIAPDLEFVQVVDGDCELRDGWLETALDTMNKHERAAIVCGRRRERYADENIYQRLIDMEWNSPVGEANTCGGDALIRVTAFREVNGYDAAVIAGEEPELCLRLRRAGWTIYRIDHEMTWHDAQLTRLSQWWKRAVRNGYAYGLGWSMHGGEPEHYRVAEVRSILEWGLLLPLVSIGLLWWTYGVSILLLGAYALFWWRVRAHRLERGDTRENAELYARFIVLGKFAELVGLCRYFRHRLLGRRGSIIEYKHAPPRTETGPLTEASGS